MFTVAGVPAEVNVWLTSKPTADVTITASGTNDSQATVTIPLAPPGTSSLTFTDANWATPQTLHVTALEDGIVRDDEFSAMVAPGSADGTYAALAPVLVHVLNDVP